LFGKESFKRSMEKVSVRIGKNTHSILLAWGVVISGSSECSRVVCHRGPPTEVVPFCRRLLATPNVILAANVANALVPLAASRS
jgi:hypothetical protein